MSKKYVIDIPEECSIPAIYKTASLAAGVNPDTVVNWDCTKILVSKEIFGAYQAYMKNEGQELSVGALWLTYGPKTSDRLRGGEVEIQDGFFHMKSNN